MFRQASLFGAGEPEIDRSFDSAARSALSGSSWIEYVPEWLYGSDSLFEDLSESLTFRQRRGVVIYDRVVDEPRLSAWWHESDGDPMPHASLEEMRNALEDQYGRHFDSIGFNLYRNQYDSVAWHADRHRHHVTDPVVAILSVGQSRPFQMRQNEGGASLTWGLGHGDLFVMGGSTQHEWQHCVPKRRRPCGQRMSITFRHDTQP